MAVACSRWRERRRRPLWWRPRHRRAGLRGHTLGDGGGRRGRAGGAPSAQRMGRSDDSWRQQRFDHRLRRRRRRRRQRRRGRRPLVAAHRRGLWRRRRRRKQRRARAAPCGPRRGLDGDIGRGARHGAGSGETGLEARAVAALRPRPGAAGRPRLGLRRRGGLCGRGAVAGTAVVQDRRRREGGAHRRGLARCAARRCHLGDRHLPRLLGPQIGHGAPGPTHSQLGGGPDARTHGSVPRGLRGTRAPHRHLVGAQPGPPPHSARALPQAGRRQCLGRGRGLHGPVRLQILGGPRGHSRHRLAAAGRRCGRGQCAQAGGTALPVAALRRPRGPGLRGGRAVRRGVRHARCRRLARRRAPPAAAGAGRGQCRGAGR
mmetsp:Transcript_46141/g.117168  ORF Transcript_46141/g.117168 Transcript_46141/m.117168 type:complete len:374 (+) Transcript_46141:767-1888(+)